MRPFNPWNLEETNTRESGREKVGCGAHFHQPVKTNPSSMSAENNLWPQYLPVPRLIALAPRTPAATSLPAAPLY